MRLNDFLKDYKDKEAAELFGVQHRTVQSWRLGYRAPSAAQRRLIEILTDGKVTADECLDAEKYEKKDDYRLFR